LLGFTFFLLQVTAQPGQSFAPQGLGSFFFRDYTRYYPMPLTAQNALSNGWVQNTSSCDPNLGIRYTQQVGGVLESTPLTLFYTPAGQLAGIGATIYGDVFNNLVNLGYLQPLGMQQGYEAYFISVTFRNSSGVCSTQMSNEEVGDTLIVNANSIAVQLPPTEAEAQSALWTKGACFSTMGYHYFYDLHSAPEMSWVGANLLPIVLMYFNGTFNAFFFASGIEQQSLTNTNEWDPIPLPDFLMCENWCSSACTFNDTSVWSTMHIYTNNYSTVTCPQGCTIHCCPS